MIYSDYSDYNGIIMGNHQQFIGAYSMLYQIVIIFMGK